MKHMIGTALLAVFILPTASHAQGVDVGSGRLRPVELSEDLIGATATVTKCGDKHLSMMYHEFFVFDNASCTLTIKDARLRVQTGIASYPIARNQSVSADICGTTFERDGATVTVSCIDFDELARITKIPMSGKVTQFLIEPRNQDAYGAAVFADAYGAAVVAKRADGTMFLKAEPIYIQPDGKKRAMIMLDGFGWTIEHLQVLFKELR